MSYRFKNNKDIDWAYDDSESVIHFKFGEARKNYNFTTEFRKKYPAFCEEYRKYFMGKDSKFGDVLGLVNYIDKHEIPVRLYSNMYDEEFEDCDAAREWVCAEHYPVYQSLDLVEKELV